MHKSQVEARESAHKDVEDWEKWVLGEMFHPDMPELEKILEAWEQRRSTQLTLDDVPLDMDRIILDTPAKAELVEDFKCAICLGVVRLPASKCSSCLKLFCHSCYLMAQSSHLQ